MNAGHRTALGLVVLFLVGSALSFAPSAYSVTQKIRNAQSAFEAQDYARQGDILLSLAAANPWWKAVWEQAGAAFLQAGDYREAISAYQVARDKDALSDQGLLDLGQAFQLADDFEAAEAVWLEMGPKPAALARLATLYEESGDLQAAAEAWEDYLTLAEVADDRDLVYHFGLLLAALSPAEALVYLDKSADLYPEAASIGAAIREALLEEPAYQYVRAGQALAAQGYWQLAVPAFAEAARLRPDYQQTYLYWGEALQHVSHPDREAIEILEQGLALDDQEPLANLFLGLYWQRQGKHEQALIFFQAAEEAWPDRPDIYIEKGRSLAALGQLASALEQYQQALELAPLDAVYYRQLAGFCVQYAYQVREVGLPAARVAVQLAGQDPANLDSMGQVLLALDDQMNAIQFFQAALAADQTYAPAYFHLGIIYSARDEADLAVYYLQQAVQYASNPALLDQAERLLSNY